MLHAPTLHLSWRLLRWQESNAASVARKERSVLRGNCRRTCITLRSLQATDAVLLPRQRSKRQFKRSIGARNMIGTALQPFEICRDVRVFL